MQVIGLGAAINYLSEIGMDTVAAIEKELHEYAREKLGQISGLTIYGDRDDKGAVISFNVGKVHSHDLAHILDTFGIAIRAGHHCAQPIMQKLGVAATNRASFYIYNKKEEIDRLAEGIQKAVEMFGG